MKNNSDECNMVERIICRRGEEKRGEEPELQKQLMLEAGPGPGFINPLRQGPVSWVGDSPKDP